MAEKVLGLTEEKVEEFVQKYGCIINRTDLVPVVTVEFVEHWIKTNWIHAKVNGADLILAIRKEALK